MELKTRSQLPGTVLPGEARRRATVVIADSGTAASVVVVETDASLSLGSCFTHGGSRWRVVGRRHDSRVLVAQPDRT